MKVPPHSKCVFKGSIFSVYQWEQEQFDGTKATFEMIKRPGTVQILPIVGDKILLAFEEQPQYAKRLGLLGGRMEENEDPLMTAKRELREETGYESNDWEMIKEVEVGGKIDWTIYYFVARDCHKVTEPKLDAGEKIEIKEVTLDQLVSVMSNDELDDKDLKNEVFESIIDQQKLVDFKQKLFS